MRYDCRGVALTTESAAAARYFDEAVNGLLGHRADTGERLAQALEGDPGLAAGHCVQGFLYLLQARRELLGPARQAAERARLALATRGGTTRERLLHRALAAWRDGEMERCAAILDGAAAAEPHDALSFKLAHAVRFMMGDAAGMRAAAESAAAAWGEDVVGYGFVLGCFAFALEETGDLASAERIGREAVEREPTDIWGCHAVAHVHEMRSQSRDGLRWLDANRGGLAGVNNFASHIAWHRALFHLALGETGATIDLYDREVRAVRSDDFRDVANAASLLWRLDRAGVDTGDRWEELAAIAAARSGDRSLVFAQLHYMLCLAASRRWEGGIETLAAMHQEVRDGWGTQQRVLAAVGLPIAKAIFAVSIGDPGRAVELALPALASLRRIGGSRVQRRVFERLLLDAAATVGREEEVRRRLDEGGKGMLGGNVVAFAGPCPAEAAAGRLSRGRRSG